MTNNTPTAADFAALRLAVADTAAARAEAELAYTAAGVRASTELFRRAEAAREAHLNAKNALGVAQWQAEQAKLAKIRAERLARWGVAA